MYVECKNITKTIKGNVILNDITIGFEQGKIHGIRGYNGSGKTMLLRAIVGLIKLSSGSIIVHGSVVGKETPFPKDVGILIEYPSFIPDYTGFKNLLFIAKINNKIDESTVRKILQLVGLDSNDKRKFKKYSLGMKQRLGIAQAIMENPDLILLDEPTNALDEKGIQLLMEILNKLSSEGKTIILTSHDRDFLNAISDYTYTISEGAISNG